MEGRRRNCGDKTVILIDDGLATGATMRAAIQSIAATWRRQNCGRVPVGPPDTCREFEDEPTKSFAPSAPDFFQAVGQYYEDFSQTSDEEVASCSRAPPKAFDPYCGDVSGEGLTPPCQ